MSLDFSSIQEGSQRKDSDFELVFKKKIFVKHNQLPIIARRNEDSCLAALLYVEGIAVSWQNSLTRKTISTLSVRCVLCSLKRTHAKEAAGAYYVMNQPFLLFTGKERAKIKMAAS